MASRKRTFFASTNIIEIREQEIKIFVVRRNLSFYMEDFLSDPV